jgi:hypothetical protein
MKDSAINAKPDRWVPFLAITLGVNLASGVLWPMLVTDAFRWDMFAASVGPVIWGFSLLLFYRTKRERYVCWAAVVGGIYWFFPTIGPPIEYWGR